MIAIGLVTLVVYLFLRQRPRDADRERRQVADLDCRDLRRDVSSGSPRLDVLSLMALTDRHRLCRRRRVRGAGEHLPACRQRACRACEAALRGAREVGFTVLSMSLSLDRGHSFRFC